MNHHQNKVNITFLFLFCIFFLVIKNAFALPEDKFAIIKLEANSADINQANNKSVYLGNVAFDQGTTHIRSHKAIAHTDKQNKLKLAIAEGNRTTQAHYWTTMDKDKPELHAYADQIYFFINEHKVELIGNSRISQGENSFSASKIIYNIKDKHITTVNDSKTRTVIIFHRLNQKGS